MGWASGPYVFEDVWSAVRPYVRDQEVCKGVIAALEKEIGTVRAKRAVMSGRKSNKHKMGYTQNGPKIEWKRSSRAENFRTENLPR
jgi:hypothetical protein